MAENKIPGDSSTPPHTPISKIRLISASTIFAAAFVLYLLTLAPTVTLVDSGELILAARSLGVAHPPGFPLYVLLAHLFSLLPLGNIATRVHLASALFAALTAAGLTLLVAEAMLIAAKPATAKKPKMIRKKRDERKPPVAAEVSGNAGLTFIFAPAFMAGLLFAFSRTLWAYATIAEVYTLNALLIVAIFWLMLSWRRHAIEAHANRLATNDRNLYIAAFLFGLALGVHHVTVGLMLPALAVLVLATEGISFFLSKRLLYAALISFAGLIAVYAYLPIAASRSPLMNWGDPRTFERIWWHVSGRQYQTFINEFALSRISEFIHLVLREFSSPFVPLALALAIAGFVYLFRRDKTMFFFLSLIIVADVMYCLKYEIDEDKDAYYLPAFIALTVAVAFGMRWFILAIQATKIKNRLTPLRASIALLLVPVTTLASNFPFDNRSHYYIAHDYVDNILKTIEPGGLLLTTDWQVYSPFLYVREIEQARRDAIVIDLNQLRRSWYFDYLHQAYPELIANSRQEVDDYLEDLRHWEHDPEIYNKDVTLNQRISKRFYDMILSFVAIHLKNAPVYVTQEIAVNRNSQDAELTTALNQKYKLLPQGLIFRVEAQADKPALADTQLLTRGLNDNTLTFADDDVVKKKVLPVYLSMLTNTGLFLASQNQHEKALEWFKQALVIDPGYEPAKRLLASSQTALQKQAAARAP